MKYTYGVSPSSRVDLVLSNSAANLLWSVSFSIDYMN